MDQQVSVDNIPDAPEVDINNLGYYTQFKVESGSFTIYVWNIPDIDNCFHYTASIFIEKARDDGKTLVKLGTFITGEICKWRHNDEEFTVINPSDEDYYLREIFERIRIDYEAERSILLED